MNYRVSRFTCLLLALLMACTLLPATVFAEGGEANAAETPAAVQAFLSAVEAISIPEEINDETGPALNEQIGAAQDAYDALSEEELAREDVQAAAAVMQQAADALTGGAEALALVTHETQTCRFMILYVDSSFNIGYNYGNSWNVDYTCQYTTGHSSYNHTIACSVIKEQVNKAKNMLDTGYEVKGWSKQANSNPTIYTTYTGTTATQTSYTIYIVAKKTAPVYYSYTVNHVYRTNGVQDGTYMQSLQTEAGTTVYASDITKQTTYNSNTYTYTSASPTSATITGNGTTFTLYYDRAEVPVPTPPNKPSDDDVITVLKPDVKVNVVCNTNAEHKKEYDVLEGSFTVSDVQGEGTDANPYTVTVIVNAEKYVEQFNNEFSGATHTSVGDNAKNITLKFVGGSWVVDGASNVTFTVQEAEEQTPDAPKPSDLANVTVSLLCRNVDGHKQTFFYSDDTAALFAKAVTFGKVEKDESGNYICTATMSAAPFLEEMNKTNPGHSLAEGSEGPQVLGALYYNGDTGEWNLESPVSGQAMLLQVIFHVTCSDEKPQGPTFEQISERLFVELNCTNKPDHSVYFKEEPFTAGAHGEYKGKLIEGSTTASDVEWDAALGAWICNVTVDATPYCEKMNEAEPWHRFADGQPSTKTVKMRYIPTNSDKPWSVVPEQRMSIQDDVVYPVEFDVTCEASTSTPAAPPVANVGLGSVTLVCDRVSAHDKQFDVLESSVTIGEVKQDAAGLYTCEVTVQVAPYLAELNKANPMHRLANGESGQASWTLYYRNGNWVSDIGALSSGMKVRHISFRVICDEAAPVYPKEYCYIDATATGGGSISPKGTVRVPVYDNQTFYMLAEPGYALVDVLVDGVSVGAVGSYTFRSVTRHHTIHAVFQPLSALPPQTGGDSTTVLFLGMGLILTACAAFVCLHRRKEN